MKYVKVSIMLRSIDALYEYNKEGRSFWEDIAGLFREKCTDTVVESGGKFRYMFYFPIQESDSVLAEVQDYLKKLGQDPDTFILSAVDASASDIERLTKNNVDNACSKAWVTEAASALSGVKPNSEGGSTGEEGESSSEDSASSSLNKLFNRSGEGSSSAPTETSTESATPDNPMNKMKKGGGASNDNPVTSAEGSDATQPQRPQQWQQSTLDGTTAPEQATPIETLAAEAEKIAKLRESLLGVVHGQRHAVDEVVQTIFECDAFNRHNDKRKAPLATFLFAGPSGVGKTFLAMQCAQRLGREYKVVDMSEYSDNLSNGKFNGEHGGPAVVTDFVRKHPDGILIFDEIEKAHINTIHMFLQILDAGRLQDMRTHQEVSFRDTIIFLTTNAGHALYDDPTVVDLSGISRRAILDGLRNDVKPGWNEPYFPECITTRFANGHVILFNHLEPYALMQIVRDEIAAQVEYFCKAANLTITYDPAALSALVLYSTGGIADARSLRGTAKNILVKEVLEVIMQTFRLAGDALDKLKNIEITVEPERCGKEVQELFNGHAVTRVPVFADQYVIEKIKPVLDDFGKQCNTEYEFLSDPDEFKRRARGVVDYVLLDPAAGSRPMTRTPNDIEDIDADGVDLFRYMKEYFPEIPVYLLDVRGHGEDAFASLLASGGRGVVELDPDDPAAAEDRIKTLSFSALVNNSTFHLGRSGKILTYNCSQYSLEDDKVIIAFDKLSVDYAPSSSDQNSDVIFGGDKNGITFKDVIGCKDAKRALGDFCKYISDPRSMIAKGNRIPKGVLLYGPPGTGKTMLAKAFANEANAAFIPTTATAFFSKWFGDSENQVREIFRRARRYAPSIIFIDEVDAIGRMRTGESTTAHYESVLNAFIAEMDGFATDERRPVFILAATNYDVSGEGSRVLDPAFVRRFDRKIFVSLPDTDDRYQLLSRELDRHGVDFGKEHEAILKNMAERSSGLSNADLTIIIDMFLRSCEEKPPTPAAFMDALDAFRFGATNELSPEDLVQTACHESGHALVARLLGETPAFLTIVSRGNYGGFMEHAHNDKKAFSTFKELMDRVCVSLAGRIAEMEVYGPDVGLNSGASSDLANARYLVKLAYNEFAMGKKLFTKGTDEDCEALMQEQFDRTVKLISENRAVLDKLTALLAEKKSLNKSDLESFFSENL